MEDENEEEVKELCAIWSAVSEPRWALHMCDKQVWRRKASSCSKLRLALGMRQFVRRMWRRFTINKKVGQIGLGRCGKRKARRDRRWLATRVSVLKGAGASILRGEVRRLGESFRRILGKWNAQQGASAKVRDCYSEVEQEDEGRLTIAHEIFEEEHGHPEADRCISRRTGWDHFVVRVSSVSLLPA